MVIELDSANVAAEALNKLQDRAPAYALYADYYAGKHRLAFATEKFRNAFGTLFRSFADNLCPVVVDAVAERLQVIGFDTETASDAVTETAWELWQINRMDRRAGEVHLEALLSGDAYVIVWPDDAGRPMFYPNNAQTITVEYDSEQPGVVKWAAKAWRQDDTRIRLTLYFSDRIEKYLSNTKPSALPEKLSAFDPYQPEGEPWPLPNPYGRVPVVHFSNNVPIGKMGASELINIIPLQDGLNKSVADMLVAMEYVALPQRWATGLEVELDDTTGKPRVPFTPGVERIWAVGDPQVRFGQFDPANLQQFLAVQNSFRTEIARVSGTPLHYLMLDAGGWPSGEAMKTAEARFLAKIMSRQQSFGNAWEDVLALALQMVGLGEHVQLSTLWQDPTPRSDRESAEVALLKQQVGVSRDQILAELGYSPEQIERMAEEREVSSADLGEAMLTAFEHGE